MMVIDPPAGAVGSRGVVERKGRAARSGGPGDLFLRLCLAWLVAPPGTWELPEDWGWAVGHGKYGMGPVCQHFMQT